SNLTNLIVQHHEPIAGAEFLRRMWPAATSAVVVTMLFMVCAFWRSGGGRSEPDGAKRRARLGVGVLAVVASTALLLALAHPALPVLACGALAVVLDRVRPAQIVETVGPGTLAALFALAVALGALGRSWHGPASLLDSLTGWETAFAAALASILVNNLPAAVLLTPHQPPHARGLLLGLNLGPN